MALGVSIHPTRLLGGREDWVSGNGWAFGGEASVGVAVGWCYDVSLIGTDASGEVNSARRSGARFQGRSRSTSSGTRLPAAAQLWRYDESQRRGLMFHCFSVATIENMAAVRQTLQSEPEPK